MTAASETLDEPCPNCARPIGDHTLREVRECRAHPDEAMNLPYLDAAPGTERTVLDDELAASVAVLAMLYDVGGIFVPALGFTFYRPGGASVAAQVTLVADEPTLRKLQTLVDKAITGSLRAVRRRRTERDAGK